MSRALDDQKILIGGAGAVVLPREIGRHEPIGSPVDEKHRDPRVVPERGDRAFGPQVTARPAAEQDIHQMHQRKGRQMVIPAEDIGQLIPRGGKAAISDDAHHVRRQVVFQRQQHRRASH